MGFSRILAAVGAVAGVLTLAGLANKPSSVYADEPDLKNPMEGKRVRFVPDETEQKNADGACGHLEAVGEADCIGTAYDGVLKRCLDALLSFVGLIALSPLLLVLSLAIVIDDPGPVLFTQKRIGKNKQYFKLHKFRSMKMSTPHDVPTHMLANPDQYITKVGKFIRAHSLDELPQIWDIFIGNMSVIGPRPALWNQDILVAERDRYGANDVRPGLTGWAQINGRDELEIPVKAKLDGDYTEKLKKGGMTAFLFDCHCFFGTILSVAKGEGVVEGGTGKLRSLSSPIAPNDGETVYPEDDYQIK